MLLSENDKKVLGILQFRSNESILEIAKACELKGHVVRRIVKRLYDEKVISRRVGVDPARIGYSTFGFWFSLIPQSKTKIREVIQFLMRSPQVSYLGAFGGSYDYKIDILLKQAIELTIFLQDFCSRFGSVLGETILCTTTRIENYQVKFLNVKGAGLHAVRMSRQRDLYQLVNIDELDERILSLISAPSGPCTSMEYSRKLKIPSSTFEYRLNRLKSEAVVVPEHVLIDEAKIGLMRYVHMVKFRSLSREVREKVSRFCESNPYVNTLVEGVGPWDYEVNTIVPGLAHELEFRDVLYESFGDLIYKVSTASILRHIKVYDFPKWGHK